MPASLLWQSFVCCVKNLSENVIRNDMGELGLHAGTMYPPTTPRIAGSDAKSVTTDITLYGHLDVCRIHAVQPRHSSQTILLTPVACAYSGELLGKPYATVDSLISQALHQIWLARQAAL
jgi:hypothetical protein